jgi:hypothetical protein
MLYTPIGAFRAYKCLRPNFAKKTNRRKGNGTLIRNLCCQRIIWCVHGRDTALQSRGWRREETSQYILDREKNRYAILLACQTCLICFGNFMSVVYLHTHAMHTLEIRVLPTSHGRRQERQPRHDFFYGAGGGGDLPAPTPWHNFGVAHAPSGELRSNHDTRKTSVTIYTRKEWYFVKAFAVTTVSSIEWWGSKLI